MAATRELSGERAQRIVAAMRDAVAELGAAAATFDNVATRAGVSRGLLHYYFGTKERLLLEAARAEGDRRMQLLEEALGGVSGVDELIAALVESLEDMVQRDPALVSLFFELFTISRRNPEIAAELAELGRRTRDHVAELLQAKEREGALRLGAEAGAVATFLFALADGFSVRLLSEPDVDHGPALAGASEAARALLREP